MNRTLAQQTINCRLVLVCLLSACRLSDSEFRTLDAWLTCDECMDGEREAVATLGGKAISRLGAALVGPSPGRASLMARKFNDSYRLARGPGPDRRQAYVAFRSANYVATYQKRAAVSLGDIGGWRARRALDQAISDSTQRHYRPDVLRVLKVVRSSFDVPPFGGIVKPSPVVFGEFFKVVAPGGQPFNGDERAEFDDALFPPSEVPSVVTGDTLATFAVADVGPRLLRIRNVGNTTNTEIAQVLVASIIDPDDRALMGCTDVDTTCVRTRAPVIIVSHVRPFIAFHALARRLPQPDTVDFFKFTAPPGGDSLSARIDWRGQAQLDLKWRDCFTFGARGNPALATALTAKVTSVAIPGGQCWILAVSMLPGGNGPAFIRLQVTSP